MRILHVVTKLDVGGAQSVVAALAGAQHGRGDHVRVVTGLDGPVGEALREAGCDIQLIDSLVHPPHPLQDPRALRHVRQHIESFRPDVIHGHSSKGGLITRLAARRSSTPSVYTAHGWPFQAGAPLPRRAASFVGEWIGARAGGHIVCVHTVDRELAIRSKLAPPSRVFVVHNGIDDIPERQRRAMDRSASTTLTDQITLVSVARLDPPKRFDVLLQMMTSLPEFVHLTIVGDGRLGDSLRKQSHELGLFERVRLVGYQHPEPFLAAADLFVLASDYEGMPVTVLEAMRAGLGVVTNRLAGVAEAAGESGSQVDLQPVSFAREVKRLIDAGELPQRGRLARERWNASFRVEHMVAAYDARYDQVIREHPRRASLRQLGS
jgi:glycosyltransferase involved in cell wall biosynthesis